MSHVEPATSPSNTAVETPTPPTGRASAGIRPKGRQSARSGHAAAAPAVPSPVAQAVRAAVAVAAPWPPATLPDDFDLSDYTALSTKALADRLGYAERTIRNTWINVVLYEFVHFIRIRRKYIFLWENIMRDLPRMGQQPTMIPMANGGYARG